MGVTLTEGLTVSRLLRYAASQACTDQHLWAEARSAIAGCPMTEDTAIAWNELEQKQKNCGCTSCTARRVLNHLKEDRTSCQTKT